MGIAWDIAGNGKTVVRANYSLVYGRVSNGILFNALTETGLTDPSQSTISITAQPTDPFAPTFPNVLSSLPASAQNFKGVRGILYVALADNRQESHVARGENAGRSLEHVAVTRILKQVGVIDLETASAKEITLPVQSEGIADYRIHSKPQIRTRARGDGTKALGKRTTPI